MAWLGLLLGLYHSSSSPSPILFLRYWLKEYSLINIPSSKFHLIVYFLRNPSNDMPLAYFFTQWYILEVSFASKHRSTQFLLIVLQHRTGTRSLFIKAPIHFHSEPVCGPHHKLGSVQWIGERNDIWHFMPDPLKPLEAFHALSQPSCQVDAKDLAEVSSHRGSRATRSLVIGSSHRLFMWWTSN